MNTQNIHEMYTKKRVKIQTETCTGTKNDDLETRHRQVCVCRLVHDDITRPDASGNHGYAVTGRL